IIETERETETLTEELSRLDEMWNKNSTDPDIDAETAESSDKSEKPDDQDEKAAAGKKPAAKTIKARKGKLKSEPADKAKDKAAKKPADEAKSDADDSQEKPAEPQKQPASAKTEADAEADVAEPVAMAEVKLPGSSMDVSAVAQTESQPVGKTLAAGANAGNNNIISLAQRIRALHSDVPGNS
ncbi:MAG: hypothetical protein AAFW74_12540, partial [Pseudomonadota bacterium]